VNVLSLIAGVLKRHASLFGVWVALCFATVLVLHAGYGVEVKEIDPTGMAVFWGGLLIAGSGVAALVRKRRAPPEAGKVSPGPGGTP
jgi:hypothetical protein